MMFSLLFLLLLPSAAISQTLICRNSTDSNYINVTASTNPLAVIVHDRHYMTGFPLFCKLSAAPQGCLQFEFENAIGHVKAEPCGNWTFTPKDFSQERELRLFPILIVSTLRGGQFQTTLTVRSRDPDKPNVAPVTFKWKLTRDAETKINCASTGDPHIRNFDQNTFDNFAAGWHYLYENNRTTVQQFHDSTPQWRNHRVATGKSFFGCSY
jgi:hypothetical protein